MATPRASSRYSVQIHRSCRLAPLGAPRVREVVAIVLSDEQVAKAELSIAIVDDAEIHRVNREHLDHDFPTDVISFLYASEPSNRSGKPSRLRRGSGLEIEGELVVSAQTADREAPRHGCTPPRELELYLVHGLLHLCGYDDLTPPERRIMRRREKEILAKLPMPKGERGA